MRFLVVIALALVINAGLFVLMDSLVSGESVRIIDAVDAGQIEFLRTPVEEELRTRDRRSAPPPKPQQIDRPQAEVTDIAARATALSVVSPSYEIAGLLGEGSGVAIAESLASNTGNELAIGMASDLIPVSMLPPQYPATARFRNIEGWVDVLFTVNSDGNVSDAWVVESEPADIFDQAAIDAAMGWRFRPVVERGIAVEAERMIRINFELDQSR